jgi:hypothetical protein
VAIDKASRILGIRYRRAGSFFWLQQVLLIERGTPVAQVLLYDRAKIEKKKREKSICGYQLNSLVFGAEIFRIANLTLDVRDIKKEHIPTIALIVSYNILSLALVFNYRDDDHLACYETLEAFFSRCERIRTLRLNFFNFGDDPLAITATIKKGLNRLKYLSNIVGMWACLLKIRQLPILIHPCFL